MNRGLFRRVWIRLGVACHVRSGLAMLGNHARAGTGLDQRQRRGMQLGLAMQCVLRLVGFLQCSSRQDRFSCGNKPPRGWRGSGFDAGWWDALGHGAAGRCCAWLGIAGLVKDF